MPTQPEKSNCRQLLKSEWHWGKNHWQRIEGEEDVGSDAGGKRLRTDAKRGAKVYITGKYRERCYGRCNAAFG